MPLLACPQLQPQAPTAPQKKHAPACLPTAATANRRRFAKSNMPPQIHPNPPPPTPAAPPTCLLTDDDLQTARDSAYLPKPATANKRRFAKDTAPLQTRTGNLLQTRPANASRHSEPLTGHTELDSESVHPLLPPPSTANKRRFAKKQHAPTCSPHSRHRKQKKSRQQKPPGKVKRQPSKKNGHLKKLLVNSSRSLCTSINCSLCSLKLLSIALLAELTDCTLTSINSFLCSTVNQSL